MKNEVEDEEEEEAMTRTLEAASRPFLEGLYLMEGGLWHLPTGQAASTAEAEQGGGGAAAAAAAAAMALAARDGRGARIEGGREGGRVEELTRTRREGSLSLPVEVLESNARLVALLVEGVGDCCEALFGRIAAARKMRRKRARGRTGNRRGVDARWSSV